MGAWAAYAFGDDTALDWLDETFAEAGSSAVKAALDAVLGTGPDEYMQYSIGVEGRAAAEVVAIAFGAARNGEGAEDLAKVAPHAASILADDSIKAQALKALDRIAAKNSEIAELWEEGPIDEWRDALSDLRSRLS